MPPLMLTVAGLSYVAGKVLEFFADDIRDSEREKRASIKRRAYQKILKAEYESRDHLLDILSAKQEEAWAEVDLLRSQYDRIRAQMDFARKSRSVCRKLEAKIAGISYFAALRATLTDFRVREHYWHCEIRRFSRRKHAICDRDLSVHKRLTSRLFKQPSFEEFRENLPVPGCIVEAKMLGLKKSGFQFEFKDKFQAIVDRSSFRASGEKWKTGGKTRVFVSRVDYRNRDVTIDPARGALLKTLEKQGFCNLKLAAPASPMKRDDHLVGYSLDWRGVRLFLPVRLASESISMSEPVKVRLVKEHFDPFNLVATMK